MGLVKGIPKPLTLGHPVYNSVSQLRENLNLGQVSLNVSNAVEAPYFQLGLMTEDEWRDSIMSRPAPWAELEVPGQVSLVIPSAKLVDIANMTKLMEFWAEMMEVANNFAGFDVRLQGTFYFYHTIQYHTHLCHTHSISP